MAESQPEAGPSNPTSAALRPVKLAGVPDHWTQSTTIRQKLALLKDDVQQYEILGRKLENITDEPVWDAMIPFGPLAYFPGQLVHTNDITVSLPSPPPLPDEDSSATSPQPSSLNESRPILKSAKQARELAARDRARIERIVARTEEELSKAEEVGKKTGGDGLEEGWALNERGEVINEEGLPIFDIQEELPPEKDNNEKPEPSTSSVSTSTPTVAASSAKSEPTPQKQMRYLIKKGGKQIVRPLKSPPPKSSTSSPIPPSSPPASSSLSSPPKLASSVSKLDTKKILDDLEREEEEEARALAAKENQESSSQLEELSNGSMPSARDPQPKESTSSTSHSFTEIPPSATKRKPESEAFLSGFGAGFLKRGKQTATTKSTPTSAPPSTSTPEASKATNPSASDESYLPPPREPLHHILPTPKSIYRPTPPPSTPNSRPSSPRPDRKVAFDVPETEPKPLKQKRAAIILPPPPPRDEAGVETEPPVPEAKKEPFVRPTKDIIVERPFKPPPGAKVRAALAAQKRSKGKDVDGVEDPLSKTFGMPPKTGPAVKGPRPIYETSEPSSTPSTSVPGTTSSPSGPIHTLSFGTKSPEGEGEASIHDIPDPGEEAPSLDPDDEDEESDSSGFYGSEDDDDEEIDIDSALHAREVALEYHRLRMQVGAGAGTGPLGGDADPDSFDSWNQPNVPLEATVQGRVPGSGGASRFRSGRLESAQMIIPTLLEQQVRHDPGQVTDEEEDGLSAEERANIAKSLAALAGKRDAHDERAQFETQGARIIPAATSVPTPSISQMMGVGSLPSQRATAPPVVRSTAVPIAVPSNKPKAGLEAEVDPTPIPHPPNSSPSMTASLSSQPSDEPPKKMSRFKARQLGLE